MNINDTVTNESPNDTDTNESHIERAPFFCYSGEMHYFRIPCDLWTVHLERAQQAHLNTVSTYIPWRWHEVAEGSWDFEGRTHPERNLQAFIKLVEQHDLLLSARVGPIANGEMVAEGLPDFLLQRYPEALLQLSDGQAIHHTGVPSYLHPVFQEKVARWYEQLLPLLEPHQQSKGGCIRMVQLCNEIAMVNWVGQTMDFSPPVTAQYQAFLSERYQTIDHLNQRYHTSFASFEEVKQPPVDFNGCLPQYLDRAHFFRDYLARYFATLHELAYQHGLRGPFSANIPHFYDFDVRGRGLYSPLTTSLFRDFPRKLPGIIFGGAYQPRRLDWDNFHDIFITSAMVRMIADPDAPIICAELQTGILSDRPRLYPSDVELNILSSIASGLDGLNAYMFSGGRNPEGLGQFGTHHGWQAPVRLDGTLDDHFAPLERAGHWLKEYGPILAQSRPLSTVQLGFYAPYWMTEFNRGPWATELEQKRTAGFFDGMARLLCCLGIPFHAVDLERQALDPALPLVLFTTAMMDEETQQRVVDYVAAKGTLWFGPELPRQDLDARPCLTLAAALDLDRLRTRKHLRLYYDDLVRVDDHHDQGTSPYFNAEEATVLAGAQPSASFLRDEQGQAAAWLKKQEGGGQVLFCGYPLTDRFSIFLSLFERMAEACGVRHPVTLTNKDIFAWVRRGEKGTFLFLINYHEYPLWTAVALEGEELSSGPLMVSPRSGVILLFDHHSPGQIIYGNS